MTEQWLDEVRRRLDAMEERLDRAVRERIDEVEVDDQ